METTKEISDMQKHNSENSEIVEEKDDFVRPEIIKPLRVKKKVLASDCIESKSDSNEQKSISKETINITKGPTQSLVEKSIPIPYKVRKF